MQLSVGCIRHSALWDAQPTYQTLQKPDRPRHDEQHLLDEGIQVLVGIHGAFPRLSTHNQTVNYCFVMHSPSIHGVFPRLSTHNQTVNNCFVVHSPSIHGAFPRLSTHNQTVNYCFVMLMHSPRHILLYDVSCIVPDNYCFVM